MPTECREYIAVPSVGDAERCEQEQVMLSLALRGRFTAGRILIDEDLDGKDVAAITGGRFPVVWCNVTFDPAMISESDWAGLVTAYGLRLYSSNYLETTFVSRK